MPVSVKFSPHQIVFAPVKAGQHLEGAAVIANAPSNVELTAQITDDTSSGRLTIVRVIVFDVDRTPQGAPLGMTEIAESDGVTPLEVLQGNLVKILVGLSVPDPLAFGVRFSARLVVSGRGLSGFQSNWSVIAIPLQTSLSTISVIFPASPVTFEPGETRLVPIQLVSGLAPPSSVTLKYLSQPNDFNFSVPLTTLAVDPNQTTNSGVLSVTCSQGASMGRDSLFFQYLGPHNLQFDSGSLSVSVMPPAPRLSWDFIGPINYAGPQVGSAFPVSGRVNAVAFDPKRPGVWYLGAPFGGVWKTIDFGNTWKPLSDDWDLLSVSSIAVEPGSANTVYVGTGDVPKVGAGMGVMKSDDGGLTWSPVGAGSFGKSSISRVLVDPLRPERVTVATFPGFVYQSADHGQTWNQVISKSTWWLGIEYASITSSQQLRYYAIGEGVGGELQRSDDGGASWTPLVTPMTAVWQQRPLVACSPVNRDRVYLFAPTDKKIFASADAGSTWKDVTGDWPDRDKVDTYTFCFACSSAEDAGSGTVRDVLYVGVYSVYQSDGANGHWTEIEGNVRGHADQHAIAVNPFDPNSLLLGNDGGVYTATYVPSLGLSTVVSSNQSLGITQVYRADFTRSDPPFIIAGTQDVGTAVSPGTESFGHPGSPGDLSVWRLVGGGDGGTCVIDPLDRDRQFLQVNFADPNEGQLLRTITRWINSSDIMEPGMRSEPRALAAPMTFDPNNSTKLYVATNFLYRWNEPTGENDQGNWDVHLGSMQLSEKGAVFAVAVAASDSNRLYTGSSLNELFMSTDAGLSWRRVDAGLPAGDGIIAISIHPQDPNDILVAMIGVNDGGGRLRRCANTLAVPVVWLNVSGSDPMTLPDGALGAIARDPLSPTEKWFVGTSVGVFVTTAAGDQWSVATQTPGLPRVPVSGLKVIRETGHLYAATFGRGIWRAKL